MQSTLLLLAASRYEALNPDMQKQIFQEYYKMVYGSIKLMVQDHAATEDIIQESFLKVIKNIPPMETETKLKAWIKVVTKNTTFNFLRKNKKNRNEIDSESVYIYDRSDYATEAGSTEIKIELKIMTETIKKCMMDLKPEYRIFIELRWNKQMSYKEIADELGTNEDTVKYKLYRAREAIKKRFFKEWGEE